MGTMTNKKGKQTMTRPTTKRTPAGRQSAQQSTSRGASRPQTSKEIPSTPGRRKAMASKPPRAEPNPPSSSSSSGSDSDSQFEGVNSPRPEKVPRFHKKEARALYRETTKKRKFLPERYFRIEEKDEEFTKIVNNLEKRGWLGFCTPPGVYIPTLVWEFYANAKFTRSKHTKVLIRDVDVFYYDDDINTALGIPQPDKDDIKEYSAKVDLEEDARPWLVSVLAAPGTTPNWSAPGFIIYKKDFNFEAKAWLALINSRVCPTRNDTKIPLKKAILIVSLMVGYTVNLGAIILTELEVRIRQKETTLPFPCLLTKIMRHYEVPLIPHIDTEIEAKSVTEVAQIRDEGNPIIERKKRKLNDTPDIETLLPDDVPAEGETSDQPATDPATSTAAPSTSQRPPTSRVPVSLFGNASLLQVPGVVKATSTVVHTMNEKLNTILQDPLLAARVFREVIAPIQESLRDLATSHKVMAQAQQDQAKELRRMGKRVKRIEEKVDADVPALKKEVSTLSSAFYRYCRGDSLFLDEHDGAEDDDDAEDDLEADEDDESEEEDDPEAAREQHRRYKEIATRDARPADTSAEVPDSQSVPPTTAAAPPTDAEPPTETPSAATPMPVDPVSTTSATEGQA